MKRLLAAIFGGLVLGVLVPGIYLLLAHSLPFGSFKGLILLAGIGVAIGAILGALFPRVFGFIFQMVLDI